MLPRVDPLGCLGSIYDKLFCIFLCILGTVLSTSTPKKLSDSSARKLSSIEGLTEKEQMQIADVLVSTPSTWYLVSITVTVYRVF